MQRWTKVWCYAISKGVMFYKWANHTSSYFHMRQTFLHKHREKVRMRNTRGRKDTQWNVTVKLIVAVNWYWNCSWQQGLTFGCVVFCSLCKLVVWKKLLQVSGEQLLLHREANPGSGLAHICLDLTDVLNVSAKKKGQTEWFRRGFWAHTQTQKQRSASTFN